MEKTLRVEDVLAALDAMTGGRLVKTAADARGRNPFVVTKTSGIPGKAVTELPGLIWGRPDRVVRKVAVLMTLSESAIELAAVTGVDLIVAHHPVADGANSGGVTLQNYLDLYDLALVELHEAFHGLHPGIAWLHGHEPFHVDIQYGGIPGNILFLGRALAEVKTVGDILSRLDGLMGRGVEERLLAAERDLRGCAAIEETSVSTRGTILSGAAANPVEQFIHIFPHTGFTADHLARVHRDHPDSDTVLATISRVYPGHALVARAEALGLNFVCGNSHALEIWENGLPLARALSSRLPGLEVCLFRDRVTSIPIDEVGSPELHRYGHFIADRYLARG